jgi:hypothetical protein
MEDDSKFYMTLNYEICLARRNTFMTLFHVFAMNMQKKKKKPESILYMEFIGFICFLKSLVLFSFKSLNSIHHS